MSQGAAVIHEGIEGRSAALHKNSPLESKKASHERWFAFPVPGQPWDLSVNSLKAYRRA